MPSAKQQPSNIKHDGGIRPNVCPLTFAPPPPLPPVLYNEMFPVDPGTVVEVTCSDLGAVNKGSNEVTCTAETASIFIIV